MKTQTHAKFIDFKKFLKFAVIQYPPPQFYTIPVMTKLPIAKTCTEDYQYAPSIKTIKFQLVDYINEMAIYEEIEYD